MRVGFRNVHISGFISVVRISLTPRQNEIYEFIRACIQQQGAPPTIPEIGAKFGMKSTNGVNDLLNVLERKGYIIRRRGTARGIALTDQAPPADPKSKGVKKLPIVGEGEASNPFSIFLNPQGVLALDPQLVPTGNAFLAVVADDGMDKEGILKGDYVVVQQNPNPPNGALVFALVGNDQVVRRRSPDGHHLLSANRYYPKLGMAEMEDVQIMGEVTGVLRVVKRSSSP